MWPWVSREAFDEVIRTMAYHQQAVNVANERYDALLEKYHALKLQGAEAPPPVTQYPPRTAEPDDELKALIAEQAGGDLRRRAIILRQLRQDRADGVSPEEIRRQIEQGIQADGVPA
jgi:hypothetical protein